MLEAATLASLKCSFSSRLKAQRAREGEKKGRQREIECERERLKEVERVVQSQNLKLKQQNILSSSVCWTEKIKERARKRKVFYKDKRECMLLRKLRLFLDVGVCIVFSS